MRRFAPLLLPLAVAACAAPRSAPSLAPRAAESIDPRLPVVRAAPPAIASEAMVARLGALLATIRGGDSRFRAEVPAVERLVAAAGPARSESWVVAQTALSGLEETLAECRIAMADIDALAAAEIAASGRIAAGDYAAIQAAAAESSAIDRRQRQLLGQLAARLGS